MCPLGFLHVGNVAVGAPTGSDQAVFEVVRHDDGHPELVLHRDAFNFAAGKGVNRFLVTLTHTDTLAQAVVVALA